GDRNGKIAAYRQMPLGLTIVWRTLAVARIFHDVVGSNDTFAGERRREHLRIARHRETRKRLLRHTRQRVEHVALARIVDDVIEERAELRARQLSRRIGHDLDGFFEVQFGGDLGADIQKYLKRPRFAAG